MCLEVPSAFQICCCDLPDVIVLKSFAELFGVFMVVVSIFIFFNSRLMETVLFIS